MIFSSQDTFTRDRNLSSACSVLGIKVNTLVDDWQEVEGDVAKNDGLMDDVIQEHNIQISRFVKFNFFSPKK